jgi:hypothetical protein
MTLPASVRPLRVPYRSQLDNRLNPLGACNVTSVGMCLDYFRAPRKPTYEKRFAQIDDELYQVMEDTKQSRHHPEHLSRLIRDYGVKNEFTVKGTIERCQRHLAAGNPCIIHGYFTKFGHIIVLVGYDEKGFFVHDPYGEWFSTGYRTDLSGENLHYSYGLIRRTCMHDNDFWVHYVSK